LSGDDDNDDVVSGYQGTYNMSVSFSCDCKPKDKKNWRVLHRRHNHSYFESPKGGEHISDYSTVLCTVCGGTGQTKAKYVDELEDYDG